MGLKSIASRTEEVVPIFAISKLIMEPVKKRGCKGGEVGNLSPLTVGGGQIRSTTSPGLIQTGGGCSFGFLRGYARGDLSDRGPPALVKF